MLFGQEIVASSTPTAIGGRDLGAVTSPLPPGPNVTLESLPVRWLRAVRCRGRGPRRDPHRGRTPGPARPDGFGVGRWLLTGPACRCCGSPSRTSGTSGSPERRGIAASANGSTAAAASTASTVDREALDGEHGPGCRSRDRSRSVKTCCSVAPGPALLERAVVLAELRSAPRSTIGFLGRLHRDLPCPPQGIRRTSTLHILLGQYYLLAFAAYGIMSACFRILAITLVNRRDEVAQAAAAPALPTWMAAGGHLLSAP